MLTLGEAVEHRLGLLAGAEARQLGKLHRQVGEAIGEGLEVLLGQQCGRHEHRDLLAVGERDERRAQRDLGLAEADVAADEPVHRLARDEILDHRLDRAGLVGRFLEREPRGEGLVVVQIETERVSLARGALGVEVEQFGRGVVRALRGLALRLVPLAAAEFVQWRRLGRGAAVAADDVQARDRDVELGVVGVEQVQKLVRPVAQIECDQAEVAPDAVLLMHHRIADAHFGQVAQHRLGVGPAHVAPGRAAHDVGVKLGFGDQRDAAFGPEESRMRRADRQRRARIPRARTPPSRRRWPA